MQPQQNIYRILESFEYHTKDIENIFSKEWLKTAIISHIAHDLIGDGVPKSFIKKTIDLIYLSDHI